MKSENVRGLQQRGRVIAVSHSHRSCACAHRSGPGQETEVNTLAKNMVNVAVETNRTAASSTRLDDTSRAIWRHVFFCCPLATLGTKGKILSMSETSEQLLRLESVIRACIHIVLSSKCVKSQFRVNYPFELRRVRELKKEFRTVDTSEATFMQVQTKQVLHFTCKRKPCSKN